MSAYATVEEFEAYVEGWVTDDEDALERLLERASRDVDLLLGPRSTRRYGDFAGFKLDPSHLAEWEATALARATCAQAEYRFDVGEENYAGHGQGGHVKGPDFEIFDGPTSGTGGSLRYGPKVAAELGPIEHLRVLTASLG